MRKLKRGLLILLVVAGIGFVIPQNLQMPVVGATGADYNKSTFWYFPWGKSVTHKGVDVFAAEGTGINSSTAGIVLYKKENDRGGKVVLVLGPKWRLHYYAHLKDISVGLFSPVGHQTTIATVGTTGNARGKAPHLHYSVVTIFPYLWRIDSDVQGWKKMFYLNPIDFLEK